MMHDPRELAGLILRRIYFDADDFQDLLRDCDEWIKLARSDGKLQVEKPIGSCLQPAGVPLMRIFPHDNSVVACILSKDGKYLFTDCERRWEVKTGKI